MFYLNIARFHISIIPIRWYNDDILMNLDSTLENSPILTALQTSTEVTEELYIVNFTLQNLKVIQDSYYDKDIQRIISQRNQFGIAFLTVKTAINIALETGSDNELVKLLKDFISIKQRNHDNDNTESIKHHQNNDDIISLQQILIDETTDPHVTKVRGTSRKKRIKGNIEMIAKNNAMCEIVNVQEINEESESRRIQQKYLLCRNPGHYQKKCLNNKR
ncbi:hypothetical protein C1645_846468 [Glomus cerebriforme]|uniref:CCHC-type domain-containing protein n=1 Tax=Glomus cerebriforme TaxID=658196 RepID=A0A397T3Z1_9GLOM|nr:hypothetical protein C1645_846468 [Glomus cerebriforme]